MTSHGVPHTQRVDAGGATPQALTEKRQSSPAERDLLRFGSEALASPLTTPRLFSSCFRRAKGPPWVKFFTFTEVHFSMHVELDPARLVARAGLGTEAQVWARSHGRFEDAWGSCDRPEWMVAMAIAAGLARPAVVAVACECIERAGRGRSLPEALHIAKSWTRGSTDGRTCWAAGFRASSEAAAERAPAVRALLQASAAAAFACDDEADAGYYASRAHAAEAVQHAAALRVDERAALSDYIRRRLSGVEVERGLLELARRATTPPPPAPEGPSTGSRPLQPVTSRTLMRLR